LAIAAAITGNILSTKREHATRVVRGLIDSVLEQDIAGLRQYVSRDVCVEDAIHRSFTGTIDGVIEGVRYVHKEIPPTSNTIILFEVFEREADAIVEVAVLTRLKRLGTIPSTWRFRVSPNKTGVWKVTSIDPVEIAFRSYR
jgi:hypothetical protein